MPRGEAAGVTDRESCGLVPGASPSVPSWREAALTSRQHVPRCQVWRGLRGARSRTAPQGAPTAPALPGAQPRSGRRPQPSASVAGTSSKALSAERRTPGRGCRGRPSFRQLSAGGGTAWLRHSRATDSLATTDTFSSSPRMWGGALGGQRSGAGGGCVSCGSDHH